MTSNLHGPWRAFKRALKPRLLALHGAYVRRFRAFGDAELLQALRDLGIRAGDSLMLHSGFGGPHGYRGTIEQLTDVFLAAVGPSGHLLMVSLPYRSSSLQYLQQGRRFDVRRTPSMMGLVSESFRRRVDVLERSLRAAGLLHERRIGNSRLIALRVRAVVAHVRAMAEHGESFYDLPAPAA